MTLAVLAEKADLDKGYISRLERGEKTPSISALLKIAEAMDVQIGELFGEAVGKDAITLVRRDAHVDLSDESSPLTHVMLPAVGERRLSAFLMEPGTDTTMRHAEHPGDEFLYVLKGQIEVAFPDRKILMEEGDCVHFDGHLRHIIRRTGRKQAQVLLVVAQDLPRLNTRSKRD